MLPLSSAEIRLTGIHTLFLFTIHAENPPNTPGGFFVARTTTYRMAGPNLIPAEWRQVLLALDFWAQSSSDRLLAEEALSALEKIKAFLGDKGQLFS